MKKVHSSEKSISLKLQLYIMSLWLLFVLIFLLTVDIPISFSKDAHFIGIIPLLERNWVAFTSLIFLIVGIILSARTRRRWNGTSNPPYQIKTIKNENYEYLTFLTTYIIPLICIDLHNPRYVLVLTFLLVIIGYVFIKMDLYYGNPSLALMGYRLYRAEIVNLTSPEGIVLISKEKLTDLSSIKWIPIDEHVWVVKEVKI